MTVAVGMERSRGKFFLPPAPPLDFPCTLVHGRQDEFYEYGKRLDAIYPDATVFEHPDGHKFPGSKELTAVETYSAERDATHRFVASRHQIPGSNCLAALERMLEQPAPEEPEEDDPDME